MTSDSPGFPEAFPAPMRAAGLLALGYRTQGPDEASDADRMETAGQVIGRYELIQPLGEGGFGVVWLARQYQPLRREVALKVIKPGLDSREVIARFEAERQALALMDHPNIAAVLDAGATSRGRPYFVMELVQGMPITGYCDQHQLTLRERVALFIPVCQAVQHAHQKAVLHRDLKPSNILVAEIDGRPVPKVIDFGIAKALGPAADPLTADHPGRTRLGTVVGTPQYMSPEQAGSGLDVDTRSDVYSLGVILCELLTGRTPLPEEMMDFAAAVRMICEGEAVRPSALVGSANSNMIPSAHNRKLDPARLARSLRGDLDWITLKALEKDRTRRYETATALAKDLQRFLEGKTVSAAAPTWHYQLGKFTRRHRLGLVAAVLVIAALVAGTAVSLWQASRAERSRAEAETNYARAREAVEKYLNSVTDHPRLQQADFQDLQRELLETALPLYEEMSRDQGDDPKLLKDRALALGRLAHLYHSVGALEKSEKTWREALEMANRLNAAFPGEPSSRMTLARHHHSVGFIQSARGDRDGALSSFTRAEEILRGLHLSDPANAQYSFVLATALYSRTQLLDRVKHKTEAEAAYLEVSKISQELVSRYPGTAPYQQLVAHSQLAIAQLFNHGNNYKEAESAYLKAIAIQEQIVAENPPDREHRRNLAWYLTYHGQVLGRMGRPGEAGKQLERALALYQRLMEEFPTYNIYRESVIACLRVMSEAAHRRGADAEAITLLERMRDEQLHLCAAVPASPTYKKELAAMLERLAVHARGQKDWAKARQLYREALKSNPGGGYEAVLAELDDAIRRPGQLLANVPPKGAASHANSPERFRLNYAIGDDPGPRHWIRQGSQWTETRPSGSQSRFTIIGPTTVEGKAGSEMSRDTTPGFFLFIPDLNTTPPYRLMMKKPDGS